MRSYYLQTQRAQLMKNFTYWTDNTLSDSNGNCKAVLTFTIQIEMLTTNSNDKSSTRGIK